jgi:hypothetical protein
LQGCNLSDILKFINQSKKELDLDEFDQFRLTEEERLILDKLAEAWNLFVKIPVQHPMHQQEFAHAIHAAQRIIMSRPTARVEGWIK